MPPAEPNHPWGILGTGPVEMDLRALDDTPCLRCDRRLCWVFQPDANRPTWHAECCGLWFHATVVRVAATCKVAER